jgi:hypothetical protein
MEFRMRRSKNTGGGRKPVLGGSWLAGVVIGTAIMTMASSAMALGAAIAFNQPGPKGG